MIVNVYQLWYLYNAMIAVQGIYVTYSFISWFLLSSYSGFSWIVSWFPSPYRNNQLEDKIK